MRFLASFLLIASAVPGSSEEPREPGCPDPAAWEFVKSNYPDSALPDPEAFFKLDPETRRTLCTAAAPSFSTFQGEGRPSASRAGLPTAGKRVDTLLRNKNPFETKASSEDMPGATGGTLATDGAGPGLKSLTGMDAGEFKPLRGLKTSSVPELRAAASGTDPASRDLADLLAISSDVRAQRLKAGHTLGTLGNLKNSAYSLVGKKVADGSGSGCRDWAEAVAGRINQKEGQRFTAGVICGGVPILAQHCVTAVYPKGQDPNDPATPVRYIDAWQAKGVKTGPIRDFLCGYGLLAIKQDKEHWAFGANPEGFNHSIALYDQEVPMLDSSGRPVMAKGKPLMRSIAQVNVPFKRTCRSK
jgi:hypothetical protein